MSAKCKPRQCESSRGKDYISGINLLYVIHLTGQTEWLGKKATLLQTDKKEGTMAAS